MLGFSDEQMAAIESACRPLDRISRVAFVEAVGVYFRGRSDIGNGELYRCLAELQREHLVPPRNRGARPQVHFKRR
jgi:hypothetical protein